MALFAGTGVSRQTQDPESAGREAARAALQNAGIESADVCIVISSIAFDQHLLAKGLVDVLGSTPFVGCTGAGAITGGGVHEGAVAVLALKSEEAKFIPVKATGIKADMHGAGKRFAAELQRVGGGDVKIALIFSDALSGNGTELVRGILETMGTRFPLGGGAAGDDLHFKKTFQFYNGEVLTDAVVGLGVGGNIETAVGADHGWQPIGIARIANKASGTKLIELDGKPAFSIYEDYFGERAADFRTALSLAAVSYPLGMKTKGRDELMIRAPLAIGDDGSITCGAEVVEGSEIYLMIGTLTGVLWSAQETARTIVGSFSGKGRKVMFVSDCVARKILLGTRGMEEINLLKTIAGPDCVIFGFYSYGQIAPLRTQIDDMRMCDPGFYEQSISLAVLGA